MSVSVPDFWRLIAESQLLPPHECQRLGQQFGGVKGAADRGNANTLAQWLVSENVISRYQATVLAAGRPGPFIYGEYKVYDRVAAGQLAGAFRAVHMPSGHPVLLRFLAGELTADPQVWAQTAVYAQKHCAVKHPHLNRAFELVDLVQFKFLVVEDPGVTSAGDLLASSGKLPPAQAAGMVRQAALGLAHLHAAGLFHGELQPVHLWTAAERRHLLWRDSLQPPQTLHAATPDRKLLTRADYLAPEMATQGKQPDVSTDIYGLGATLYHLLTGQPPFAGGDVNQKMQRHASEAIAPLEPHGVPQPLAQAVAYMMAKNPSVRFPDANVVAQQLAPFVSNEDLQPRAINNSATLVAIDDHLQRKHAALQAQRATTTAAAVSAAPATTTAFAGIDLNPSAGAAAAGGAATVAATGATSVAAASASASPSTRIREKKPWHKNTPLLVALGSCVAFLLLLGVLFASGTFSGDYDDTIAGTDDGEVVDNGSDTDTDTDDGSSSNGSDDDDPNDGGEPTTPDSTGTADRYTLLASDDGQTLWASPTTGDPIDTAFVPADVKVLLVARPAEVLAAANGQAALRAMGPEFASMRSQWESTTGVTANEVERLIVALHSNDNKLPRVTSTVHLKSPQDMKARWGNPSPAGKDNVFNVKGKMAWIPPSGGGRVFVMGDAVDVMPLAQSSAERPKPALSPHFADFIKTSDGQRHVTLLFDPNFLHTEGRPMFAGPYKKLIDPIRDWFGNYTKGMVSMHFGGDFYGELRVYARLQKRPGELKTEYDAKLAALPGDLKKYILSLNPPAYWKPLWFEFPRMLGYIHEQTRLGLEDDMTVINFVVPGHAAPNLVAATELSIATAPGANYDSGDGTTQPPPTSSGPKTIEEVLASKFTLGFDQMSLEFAMRDLGKDVADEFPSLPFQFKVIIIGDDLKIDGITRNQQVREFSKKDVPVSEILTGLVMKANPITTVTDPSEADQKLIWVVGPDPSDPGKSVILITTRAAAEKKNYTLPAPFQPK